VIEPGTLGAGDAVVIEHRPGHGVTVGDTFRRPIAPAMQRLLAADGVDGFRLTPKMRQYAIHYAAPRS
jgi:MOSC domain-containing protein YiiM